MAFAQKNDFSANDYKSKYQDITALYDHADELIATVEDITVKSKQKQLDLVELLVNEVADATDILTEEFILVAESKKPRGTSKFSKKRIEGALRRIFVAISGHNESAKHIFNDANDVIVNITDKIVKKIQHQLDKVVLIFLELINISLQSIIGKAEMEALRVRNTRISVMMHQLSLSQMS
jgi:vacuolar-type H+-ATPase subunit E/Vma4